MAEMLLQSHAGELSLLPALPPAWSNGNVTGLRARGDIGVDLKWSYGRGALATITPRRGGDVVIRVPRDLRVVSITAAGRWAKVIPNENGAVRFSAQPRQVYEVLLASSQ